MKEVNPKENAIDQANDCQDHLRGILANKLAEDSSLPFLLEREDFIFGSAVRKTKPAPIDDIDLMLVLDGSMLFATENGQTTGTVFGSGKSYNPVLNSVHLDDHGFVSSQKILNRIREAVDETYSRSEIRKDGQAVNLWLESYGLGIDIVPAFKVSHYLKGTHYFIPAGTGSHMWQSTNPLVDLKLFSDEDQRLGGLLCSAARLMRRWNEFSNEKILSGFHVDALVLRSLYNKNIQTLENAVWNCITSFENLLASYSQQFTGFGPHIDHKLSVLQREKSKQNIRKAVKEISSIRLNSPFLADPQVTASRELSAWDNVFSKKLLN
jgi:hypothetical protein